MDQEYYQDEHEQERRRLMRLEMKRKQRWQRIILFSALALVLALIITLIVTGCRKEKEEDHQTTTQIDDLTEQVQKEVEKVKATLTAVGDIMCYSDQIDNAKQSDGSFDFAPSLAAVAPLLRDADLTVGNLELNFAGADAGYSGYPNFNAPESLAAALADAGFDILQTANTYSIQNGVSGLNNTIKYLTQQNIAHAGTYFAQSEKDTDGGVIVRNINGIRFAFIAYTKGVNNKTLPESAPYCVDLLYTDYSTNYTQVNTAALEKSLAAAKSLDPDVIVAMLHWGSEYELETSSTQEEIATLLFQGGVDVILGSHSHEVGQMETREISVDGRKKTVFLAYSLGNFLSAMTRDTTQSSCVLNLAFTKDPETGVTEISEISYVPIYLADHGSGASPRFEVLPVRATIAAGVRTDLSSTLNQTIEVLKTHTKSAYDSGT